MKVSDDSLVFIDTETIGFLGDTVLIQYGFLNDDEVFIHHVFKEPIKKTLELIEFFSGKTNVMLNAPFDIHKLALTYNKLKALSLTKNINKPPRPKAYYNLKEEDCLKYCYNPVGIIDLDVCTCMSIYQKLMKQDNVRIRQVPITVAESLRQHLESTLSVDDIFFAGSPKHRRNKGSRWQIKRLNKTGTEELQPGDSDDLAHESLCNLHLIFDPRRGLKYIAKFILGFEDTEDIELPMNLDEDGVSHWVNIPLYKSAHSIFVSHWSSSKPLEYARRDIIYTREYFKHLRDRDFLFLDSVNHRLTALVGNTHWSGFNINTDLAMENYKKCQEFEDSMVINYRSPKQVKKFLETSDPFINAIFDEKGTGTPVLKSVISEIEALPDEEKDSESILLVEKANLIVKARKNYLEKLMLEKFIRSGRLYCSFKVVGTKSNRMAGGGVKKGINPQGIGNKRSIRECLTMADEGEVLCGGDFDSFEVSIMDALYNDDKLRESLKSGKKFHALYGIHLFNMTYEELLSEENEYFYKKAKIAVFAGAYGAEEDKIAKQTGTHVEDARRANRLFQEEYKGIGEAKRRVKNMYNPIKNLGKGKTTFSVAPDCRVGVKSFIGFTRHLSFEYDLAEYFYNISTNLPNHLRLSGTVVRRDKKVTIEQATKSALFGTCFSICGRIQRAAGNHEIQSPGGQTTKNLQAELFKLQPLGVEPWVIKVMNVHDEILTVTKPESIPSVENIVHNFIEENKKVIPLIGMTFAKGDNWYAIH